MPTRADGEGAERAQPSGRRRGPRRVAPPPPRTDPDPPPADGRDPIDGPSFGRAVRAFRNLRGLTIPQLAADAGVAFGSISMLERGHIANVGQRVASGLAEALGFRDVPEFLRYAYGAQERRERQGRHAGFRLTRDAVAGGYRPAPPQYEPPTPAAPPGWGAGAPIAPRVIGRPHPVYLTRSLPVALRATRPGERIPDLWDYPPLAWATLTGPSGFGIQAPHDLPEYGIRELDRLWIRAEQLLPPGGLLLLWSRGERLEDDAILIEPVADPGTIREPLVCLGTVVLVEPFPFPPRPLRRAPQP